MDLILYRNIDVAYAERPGRSSGALSEPSFPVVVTPKDRDEWLQGGGFVWHPGVPPRAQRGVCAGAYGLGCVSSRSFGELGLSSAFGGSLSVPVASAPALCVLALLVYQANQESALLTPRRWCWWDSARLGQNPPLSTAILHSFLALSRAAGSGPFPPGLSPVPALCLAPKAEGMQRAPPAP